MFNRQLRSPVCYFVLFLVLFFASGPFLQAQTTESKSEGDAAYNRVAVLHGVYENGYGKNIHSDEYDNALKNLNWTNRKFASTTTDMDRFLSATDRGELDIALFCPLFNYGKDVIDMSPYAPRLARFVENGGAIVIPDALYPENLKWLTLIDETLKLGAASCKAAFEIANTEPTDSIRFLPNRIQENNTWNHLVLPKGHGWTIIARCSEGEPQVVMKRIGKGFIYVCGPRFGGGALLENFRANLELQRRGLTVAKFDCPTLTIGDGSAVLSLQSLSGPVKGQAVISVAPQRESVKQQNFTKDFSLGANQIEPLTIPYTISQRGLVRVTFTLFVANQDARQPITIFEKAVTIPEALTVSGPAYRGFAVQSELKKNDGRIWTTVAVAPLHERLETLKYQAVVKTADGKTISQSEPTAVSHRRIKVPVRLSNPPVGSYTIEGTLWENGSVAATNTAEVTVLADSDCPVYINSDLNLVANGEEFFPIGIYHVNPKEMAQAASLGFNTVQMFSWFFDEALIVPKQYGIQVLYEQNHRAGGEDWVGQTAVDLSRKFSNVLMWYGMDEPSEQTAANAKAINDVYHRFDKGHPTLCVSCTPALFAKQTVFGDVFAVDPYPCPNSPISQVSVWMDRAWEATQGEKPVFLVAQSFGTGETSDALRAMAYQGIIHEARGIFWYPWDDGGTLGLKYHPELQPVIKSLISEIKTLAPALLNKDGREQIRSENRLVHGLFCQEKTGKRYLLLVNPETTDQTIDLATVSQLKNAEKLKEVFGSGIIQATAPLTLKAYQTCAFEIR